MLDERTSTGFAARPRNERLPPTRPAALITARLDRVAAIVLVGPRPCVAAARGDPHDTDRVPARLVRERLRQIGEQVDLRDRLGAVRHSGLDGAAKADFDVRLVLDAQVQGALAVLLGRHERLLVLRDALVLDDAVDDSPVEWDVDLGPERTRMLAGPTACDPPTRYTT